jgi:hypothetical protein
MREGPTRRLGSRRSTARGRAAVWARMVFAVALAAVLALLELGLILGTVGATRTSSRSGSLIGTIIVGALLVAAARWVVALEHRLRAHQPVAAGYRDAQSARAGAIAAAVHPRRGRHYSPVVRALLAIVFPIATIGCIAGAVSDHAQAARSAYTQQHGVPEPGHVLGAVNDEHCGRSSCSYTAAITVSLGSPVGGAVTSTVHLNAFTDALPGDVLPVLVDPRQPDYAELPGRPFKGAHVWIVEAVLALFFGAITALEAAALAHLLEHRRRIGAASGAQPAVTIQS